VQALIKAVQSNMAAVEAAQREIEVGTSTMVEFLEALRDLYRARRDLTGARHDYLLNRWRLLASVGHLGQADLEEMSRLFTPGPPLPLQVTFAQPVTSPQP
jgi:outer membrane protein